MIKKELKSFVIQKYRLKEIPKRDIFYIDNLNFDCVYVYSFKDLSKFEGLK